MIKMIKLGGSLITNKTIEKSIRQDVVQRISQELADVLPTVAEPVIIGHGSGSFGHFAAKRHATVDGVHTRQQWHGFAEVCLVAAELSQAIAAALFNAGLPVMRFQPSATLLCNDAVPQSMELTNLKEALRRGLIPLVYGDVSFDAQRGGTIASTEMIFTYLASALNVSEIFLVGEVDGVFDQNGIVIPRITPSTLHHYHAALRGSEGTDVTGGMLTKVSDMVKLVTRLPHLSIHILNGLTPNAVHQALCGNLAVKTTICAD
jgi:isopentenyl phosphate kinase